MDFRNLGPKALLWMSFMLIPMIAAAGGTITGVVIDGFTGQPVRGATLTVEGMDISFPTGVGGDFRGEAPAGIATSTVLNGSSGAPSGPWRLPNPSTDSSA